MYIFPIVGGVTGGTQSQTTAEQLKKSDSGEQTGQNSTTSNTTTQKTVSIFSNYDNNQDKYVKYNEAGSLFTTPTFNNTDAGNADYSQFGDNASNAKSAVKNMAQQKMGGSLSTAFNSLLKSFSSKTGSEKYTYNANDEETANKTIAQKSSEMDKIAQNDAKSASDTAQKKVWDQYTEALDSAFKEYSSYTEEQKTNANNAAEDAAKNTEENSENEVDTENGNSKLEKTKTTAESGETDTEGETAADGTEETSSDEAKSNGNVSEETKTEKTVYATSDADTNEHVAGTESSILSSSVSTAVNNLSSMTPAHLDKNSSVENIQNGLRAMASGSYDAASMYQSILSSFDVSTGSKTVEVKDGEEAKAEQKLTDAQTKMDAKVTKAETKANKEIAKVTANYENALEAALKQYETTTDSSAKESLLKDALDKQAKAAEEKSKAKESSDSNGKTEGASEKVKSSTTSKNNSDISYLLGLADDNKSDTDLAEAINSLISSSSTQSTSSTTDSSSTETSTKQVTVDEEISLLKYAKDNDYKYGELILLNEDKIGDNEDDAIKKKGLIITAGAKITVPSA